MAYLAAVFIEADNLFVVDCIREFTPEQLADFNSINAGFNTLRKRLALLHILEQNFLTLGSFINELQVSGNMNATRAVSEANRHFMNYLSSGYSLREHLARLLKRDFGRKSEQASKFLQLLRFLEENHFAYAFFQDFRDFVQHCGFPVGNMNLRQDKTESVLSLTHPKTALLNEYKDWRRSNLSKRSESEFDLIALVKMHHEVVIKEFSAVILSEYGKSLNAIQTYFLNLQNEAKTVRKDAEARIVTSITGDPSSGGVAFQDIPLNPLVELGLSGSTPDQSHKRISAVGRARISVRPPPQQAHQAKENDISVLSYRTEERDRYFDVRKNDIIGFHPEWTNLDFDPFPNAKNDDIVHRAAIGRELVLYAKLEAPVDAINLGIALVIGGRKFALDKVTFHFNAKAGNNRATFDVEGSEWLTYIEPVKIIADMRKKLASGQSHC